MIIPPYSGMIFLQHHCEPQGDQSQVFGGWAVDQPLSVAGKSNAEQLAHAYGSRRITKIYTSAANAAAITATTINRLLLVDLCFCESLRELDTGTWTNLTHRQITDQYPVEYTRWQQDPVRNAPPGGETYREALHRIYEFVRVIEKRHFGENIILVGHTRIFQLLIAKLSGVPLYRASQIDQDVGSIALLRNIHGDLELRAVTHHPSYVCEDEKCELLSEPHAMWA